MNKRFLSSSSFLCLIIVSCSQSMLPDGEWAEPVDFNDMRAMGEFNFSKLIKNYVFSLECGEDVGFFSSEVKWEPLYQRQSSEPTPQGNLELSDTPPTFTGNSTCSGIAKILESMGGELWKDPQTQGLGATQATQTSPPPPLAAHPLIKIKMFEYPPERDSCGGDFVLMVLTFGIFPCVESIKSTIELSLSAQEGKIALKKKFTAQVKAISGIPALSFAAADLFRPEKKKKPARNSRLAQDFIRSIQNNLATFLIRLELTKKNDKNSLISAY